MSIYAVYPRRSANWKNKSIIYFFAKFEKLEQFDLIFQVYNFMQLLHPLLMSCFYIMLREKMVIFFNFFATLVTSLLVTSFGTFHLSLSLSLFLSPTYTQTKTITHTDTLTYRHTNTITNRRTNTYKQTQYKHRHQKITF